MASGCGAFGAMKVPNPDDPAVAVPHYFFLAHGLKPAQKYSDTQDLTIFSSAAVRIAPGFSRYPGLFLSRGELTDISKFDVGIHQRRDAVYPSAHRFMP
jgi:hypothetical protein